MVSRGAYLPALVCALLGHAPAWSAQGIAYCSVTSIETKQLSNAVQVTVRADGLMRIEWDGSHYFNLEKVRTGTGDPRKPVTYLPFRIANARSRIGSFADVGVFPVSHVEVSIPPGAPEGVGLDLRVVLYTEVIGRSMKLGNDQWEITWLPDDKPVFTVSMTPDQRSLIFLVTRETRSIPPPVRRKPDPGAPTVLEIALRENGRVSIDALNADLRGLVQLLGERTGKRLFAEEGLDRVVGLSLQDVTPEEALEGIATAYGLSVEDASGVIRVCEGPVSGIPTYGSSTQETIRLKHITAVAARNSLPEFLLRFLHVDGGENALTVFGPRLLVEKVRRDVEKLDQPLPQIEYEVAAVEFASTEEEERFLRQQASDGDQQVDLQPSTGDIAYRWVGRLSRSFEADLHALVARGRARLRSRARAVVLNGRTASLFAGQQRYIKVEYFDYLSYTYNTRVFPVDVGTSLDVTPWSGGGGQITARITSSVSSVAEIDRKSRLPVVSTRRAETVLRVRDGDTVVIGGLALAQDENRSRRLPLVGRMPVVGTPFQAPERARAMTELALFVTARIATGRTVVPPPDGSRAGGVQPGSPSAGLSRRQAHAPVHWQRSHAR